MVYLPSKRDWTVFSEKKIRSWLVRRDKMLALVRGRPDEVEISDTIISATSVHIIKTLIKAGRIDEARSTLLQVISVISPLERDGWYHNRIKQLALQLAVSDASPENMTALLADVERAGGGSTVRSRLQMRALLSDIWTGIALHEGKAPERDDRLAASAAVKAIAHNPFKPLWRPGILRLVARAGAAAARRQQRAHSDRAEASHVP
jgi:hypothetical protein